MIQKMEIKGTEIQISINLNLESEMEEQLIIMFGNSNSEVEKNRIYEALFLHFSISLNCLRPQTGKNQLQEHNPQHLGHLKNTQNFFHDLRIKKKIKFMHTLYTEYFIQANFLIITYMICVTLPYLLTNNMGDTIHIDKYARWNKFYYFRNNCESNRSTKKINYAQNSIRLVSRVGSLKSILFSDKMKRTTLSI